MRTFMALVIGAALIGGCHDPSVVGPGDSPPAAPRGVRSVTGDHEVFLSWLPNTESDVVGYSIYVGDCPGGPGCLYDPIGSTRAAATPPERESFVVTSLANGQLRYYAVSAVDRAGNESELSYDVVFDTPRPEGVDLQLSNALTDTLHAGYDFSAYAVVPYHDPDVDIFYGSSDGQSLMLAPFLDTEIQDAGYASTLDAVDYAPTAGWSPSGTVELIVGHCYVVRTRDAGYDHYGKFRVTALTSSRVTVDWAYQVDPGNPELRARPASPAPRVPRSLAWPGAAVATAAP